MPLRKMNPHAVDAGLLKTEEYNYIARTREIVLARSKITV